MTTHGEKLKEEPFLISPLLVPMMGGGGDVPLLSTAITGDEVDTPTIDKKKYRVIRLPNQLTALLISTADLVEYESQKRLSVLMDKPNFKDQGIPIPPQWASRDKLDTSQSSSIGSFLDDYGLESTIRAAGLCDTASDEVIDDMDERMNNCDINHTRHRSSLSLSVCSPISLNGNNKEDKHDAKDSVGDGYDTIEDGRTSGSPSSLDDLDFVKGSGIGRSGWMAGDDRSDWSGSDDSYGRNDLDSLLSDVQDESSEEDTDQAELLEEERYHHKAAVAVSVGVGSYCDPEDIPGLAHFLEHMLYMGTETYRTENALDSYLHRHGGDCNASTDVEMTVFQFNVQDGYLEKALAIFSRFFKEPLLLEDAILREAAAVDAEFELSRYNDNCRRRELLLHRANQDSPMSRFTWGSYNTLVEVPKEKNIDVRGALRDLCNKYYRPNLMKLTVISTDSLDNMQIMVEKHFNDLVPTKYARPNLAEMAGGDSNSHAAFTMDRLHKLVKIVPVERRRLLQLTFTMPSLNHKYKSKPASYIFELLGHEGPGSILSYLKRHSLGLAFEAGNSGTGIERNSAGDLAQIIIELTTRGEECVGTVIAVIFQYLRMLRKIGIQKWIFEEQQAIYNMAYQFAEEVDPIELVEQLAYEMQFYPDKDILTGNNLVSVFEPEWIRKVLDWLTPNTMCVMITSKKFEGLENLQQEPRFGTPHIVEDIPSEWMELCRKDVCDPDELYLPAPNEFLATDFSIRPRSQKEQKKSDPSLYFACLIKDLTLPSLIYEGDRSKLWFKQDEVFNLPRAYTYFSFTNQCMYRSPKNVMIIYMYILLLTYNSKEFGYGAEVAQLSYEFNMSEQGFTLKLAGFNHKLPVLFDHLVTTMTEFHVSEAAFADTRDLLIQEMSNDLIKPDKTSQESRLCILQRVRWSTSDKLKALESLKLSDVTHFLPEFMSTVHIQSLIQGNITEDESLSLFHLIMKRLECDKGLPSSLFPMERVLVIEPGTWIYRIPNNNPTDDNNSVENYYQIGPETLRGRVMLELLEMILFEPCFDYLRTKRQLGYDVGCEYRNTHGILGFSIRVLSRSRKYTVEHVAECMEEFLVYAADVIRTLDENDFQEHVDALQAENLRPDIGLQGEVDRNWKELMQHSDLFDRYLIEAEVLRTVSKAELLEWHMRYLLPSVNRKHLCIQVFGLSEGQKPQGKTVRRSLAGLNVGIIDTIHEFKKQSYLYPHMSASGL
eukprot:CFRG7370T1